MLLYLVCHGKCQSDNEPSAGLSAEGRAEAGRLAAHLALVPFASAWTSGCRAAHQSATMILGPHSKVTLCIDPRLDKNANGTEVNDNFISQLGGWLHDIVASHTPLSAPNSTPRTPTTPNEPGAGSVLAVTQDECVHALLTVLRRQNGLQGPIDLLVPETVDTERTVGSTSLAIVRVWWEEALVPGGPLECRGRLEAWGDDSHLLGDVV